MHDKARAFAVKMIRCYRQLTEQKREYVLSKQVLRSATSIGANITEALCGVSKKDFLAKMYIAFKECSETRYWLDLLHETEYLNQEDFDTLDGDAIELQKLLSCITKSTAESLKNAP